MTTDYTIDDGPRVDERTNTAAMISLCAALLGLFPVALVFGAIGYVEVGGRPHERGSGIALAGLILGLLELVAVTAIPLVLVLIR